MEAAVRVIGERLSLPLSTTQVEQLARYIGLLQRWNGVYNLTAVRDESAMLTHHLADCLAVIAPLRRHWAARSPSGFRLLDVGSGAGLPGVVIAIVVDKAEVVCVDSVAKKTSFIRQAAGELGLAPRLQAQHARVEDMQGETFDVVTARAFSSLPDLVALTSHVLSPEGVWLAMKGRTPDDEIRSLPSNVEMFHVEPLIVPELDAERCLVWLRTRSGLG